MKLKPGPAQGFTSTFNLVEVVTSNGERSTIQVNNSHKLSDKEAVVAVQDQVAKLDVVAVWQHKYQLIGRRVSVSEKKIPT